MWVIVQEDPFISLSKGECVGPLVVLNRVSSGSIRGFGILMWCQSTRRRGSEQHDPERGSVGDTGKNSQGATGGHKTRRGWLDALDRPPSPRPERVISAETSHAGHSGRNMFVPDWTGPLKGYLKGLLRLW